MKSRLRKLRALLRKLHRRAREVATRTRKLERQIETVAAINEHLGYGASILEEAQRVGIELALACALVEQESGGRNIFGCDLGPRSGPPYCHQDVTRSRVEALIAHVNRGGASNGVGLTQLTTPALIFDAEEEGGAHLPRCQLNVGFHYLRSLIGWGNGVRWALGAYNGGPGNPQFSYADEVLAKRERWRQRLDR